MTNDEVKAVWAADINSLEKFQAAHAATRHHIGRTWLNTAVLLQQRDPNTGMTVRIDSDDIWPLQRDMIRESIQFYPEPTSVLRWLRTVQSNTGLGQMFPHVSREDKTQIAFTPDAQQGKADRKQRMSVGRFLRKFLLWVPDSEIQRLDQQHRSELDHEFLLAETVDAIREVYMEMDGDSGCMRYDLSNFSHVDYHPSAVYASPGMGVAYTMDDNGTVKSRSVIWVNPDDASDKRYVRVYGDVILKKKLEMNGFKMRGLVGAKLRILRDSSFNNYGTSHTMVMPWIDPAGGIHAHNVDRSYDSEHAIRFKGEDFITLVSADQQAAYMRAGIHCANVQSQSGHVDVPEVDPSTFQYVCAVSGKTTNRMETATVLWLSDEGTVQQARANEASSNYYLVKMHEGRQQSMYCTEATRAKFGIPGYPSHFNDEPTRESAGLCMLDKAFYSDSERYYNRRECVFMEDAEGNHLFIKKEDALVLYKENADQTFIHIDMVKAMKSEGCVPVAVLNGMRGLAHKDHKYLVVTRGGKRVIRTKHDVSLMWDGTWEYTRNVVTMQVAGITLNVGKTETMHEIVIPDNVVHEHYATIYGLDPERRTRRMLEVFRRGFQGGPTYMRSGENVVACDYYNKTSELWPMVDAANGILAMQEDAEWMQRVLGYQRVKGLAWARVVVAAYAGMKAHDKEHALMMAEANAVEAAPTTQAVIEHLNTLADSDMDRLIAEVDDTLATAVVRRWPRLQAAGMLTPQAEQPMAPVVAAALDQMEAVMGDRNGTAQPTLPEQPVNPAAAWPVTTGERAAATQFMLDDALLSELQSVGLAPIVIDENTDFNALPRLT